MFDNQVGEALTVDQDDPVLDAGNEDRSGMIYLQPLPINLMPTRHGCKRMPIVKLGRNPTQLHSVCHQGCGDQASLRRRNAAKAASPPISSSPLAGSGTTDSLTLSSSTP
jgi:hypothetical protein